MNEKLTNEEIKLELCYMLKNVSDYLIANNIKYSIMSGTMLGAVRHGGFIPWDDDIDIAILRKDYDILINKLKKNKVINYNLYASGYELGTEDWPFIKIYDDNILIKDNGMARDGKLWIDIFPFDNISLKSQKKHICIVMFFRKLFFKKRLLEGFYKDDDKKNGLFNILKSNIGFLFAKCISKKNIMTNYLKACTMYKNEDSLYVQDLTWGFKPIPKFLFDNIVDYKFENIVVKGFEDYDLYLKTIYGDYMELPPIEKRENHGIEAWRVQKNEE